MSDHTPGPWRFSKKTGYVISEATGERVCSPHSTLLNGTVSDEIKDLKRNARLIAAAPDLLEFVQEWLGRQDTDENYMIAKARAAIAKATGQTE